MESAPDPGLEHVPGSGSLSPRLVGQRVVVRSRVPDQTGPSGGPAFTDVLGVLESWAEGVLTIRTADHELVEIPSALIVSGKPVPPRPSRFSRLSADEVEHRCSAFSRPSECAELGDWQLRVTEGTNPIASTALLAGDPGTPIDDAIEILRDFYVSRGRRPAARVVAGSVIERELEQRGWTTLDVDRADSEVLVAGVAALARQLSDVDISDVHHESVITYDWLVGNERAQANFASVAAALDLANSTFASLSDDDGQTARARANEADGWAFFADLYVQPHHRRRGLARIMTAALVQWAAERGASVFALQVNADNAAAQALYAGLGFERHHGYRYLVGPD